jgi:NAD-dependent deacetylase
MTFSQDLLIGLLRARRVVVFTGAGISAESGIPTFRDAQTGLWEQYEVSKLASPEGYQADKALVWGWYEWRRMKALQAKLNAGHMAIAELAGYVERLTVITQNVDDLHERAGSRGVIHLHGSLHKPGCFDCNKPYDLPSGIPDLPEGGSRVDPPKCSNCTGSIRPGVVWFGETMPEDEWQRAEEAALNCDIMLVVGTSSLVWPASQLPEMAAIRGAKVVQINPDNTPLDRTAHFNFKGKAGEVLPVLVSSLDGFL